MVNKLNLKKLLSEKNVFLSLEGNSKNEIITEMIHRLVISGLITDEASAYEAVLQREQKMSTGMEGGVAIPHGKTDSVGHLVPAIAIKKDGVDFDSIDKQPSRIFIMTISPAKSSGPHIQFLAEITGLLKNPKKRDEILSARTWEEVVAVFS
jgi:fructose-specific phosphotransferase system IIA component